MPLGLRAREAIVVLVGMVVLLATGIVPSVVAGLLAAGAWSCCVVSVEGAYKVDQLDDGRARGRDDPALDGDDDDRRRGPRGGHARRRRRALGPYALLAGLFLITATLGQLISNMATALIMIPIAVAAASSWASSPSRS